MIYALRRGLQRSIDARMLCGAWCLTNVTTMLAECRHPPEHVPLENTHTGEETKNVCTFSNKDIVIDRIELKNSLNIEPTGIALRWTLESRFGEGEVHTHTNTDTVPKRNNQT